MDKKYIKTNQAPEAIGPYSQAIKAGQFLFISGQIGLDPDEGELVADDIETQTKQVLKNLEAILKEENLSFANVVESTIYLMDLNDFQKVNILYAHAIGTHRPARATVQVAGLPKNAKIEIKMTAVY